MAYSSSWKRGQVSSGWSRYPKQNDINVQMKNIAEYNLGPVGYQDPNAVSKIFTGTGAIFKTTGTYFQNSGPQNQNRNINRNTSKGRLRRSLGQWLGTNNQNQSQKQRPIFNLRPINMKLLLTQ